MNDPGPARNDAAGDEATSPRAARHRVPLRAAVRPLLTATGLVVAYYLLPMDERVTGGMLAGLVGGLAAVVVLLALQIRSILRSPHPRLRAVEALATTVPLFLLLFAAAYYLLERAAPGSFTEPLTRTDALYFTLTVFSTVGFGDITARTEPARIVTMTQMTANVLLVGVAARIVVGAVQAALRRQPADGAPPPRRHPGRP
ncbi:potassium channel family protein [Streptomyces sp. NPDC002896]|uniref:potassium channel family protein n=1 Tax=Streptomyces sp. NPDC002896 TaxID=3154438 RepID=UPI00332DCB50